MNQSQQETAKDTHVYTHTPELMITGQNPVKIDKCLTEITNFAIFPNTSIVTIPFAHTHTQHFVHAFGFFGHFLGKFALVDASSGVSDWTRGLAIVLQLFKQFLVT